ncbi:hypothetical protein [Natrinema sp. DC36]|uniref:hypothetical protein n=1 Tax=Natrinema sp. DC36 TaxID=2878680 RepID=UPI001CF05C6F|nr:hypothetical protein [Natrinema sp. DC36]
MSALFAGCLSGRSNNRESDQKFETTEEIVDEEQLLEISIIGQWESFDDLRYLTEDDELRTLEPSRERWIQPYVLIDHIGELTLEQLEKPATDDAELVSIESGDRFEPTEWPHNGVEFAALREDHLQRLRGRGDWYTGGKTSIGPVFDAPEGDVALDVSEIVEQDDVPLLK